MIEKHNFTDEISKIGYAGSFLNGTPADWWHGLFQRYEDAVDKGNTYPVELTSFAEFSRALTTSFGDPDLTSTMERKLRTLRQTASVADYATEFQRIAGYLTTAGWSDHPLLSNYRANLKDNIKKSLVHETPFPTTLREMIAATIHIDNCEYEMMLDRKVSLDRKVAAPTPSSQPTTTPSIRTTPTPLETSTNGCAQE
jgi:Retrotransposon gag protein